MARVLITGGTGFVARKLAETLVRHKHQVLVTTRQAGVDLPVPHHTTGPISATTDWSPALDGIDVVIHMAAQIKPSGPTEDASWATFMSVNRDGTKGLADAALKAGVSRFIYVSSILACGDHTLGTARFSENGQPLATDGYGVSKRAAENELLKVCTDSPMEYVILRPAPIYGPQLANNILLLFKAVDKGWPLPVGSIENTLDFVGVDNLVSALRSVISEKRAANRSYFICDQEQTSTPAFIGQIATALGKKARLLPCPVAVLRLLGKLTGRSFAIGRLVNSLNVDGSAITRELGWQPEVPMAAGLKATAEWYTTVQHGNAAHQVAP